MPKNQVDIVPNSNAGATLFSKSRRSEQRAEEFRRQTIASVLAEIRPGCVWDLDGNTTAYRSVIRDQGIHWIPFDLELRDKAGCPDSPWTPRADLVIAFGVLHRLRITKNFTLARIAQSLENLADWLLIEFVPKEDTSVRTLLRGRPESFEDYYLPNFYGAFRRQFEMVKSLGIPSTPRSIYLFKKRSAEVAVQR